MCMGFVRVIFLLFLTTLVFAKSLDVASEDYGLELLSHSKIYIDPTKSLTINDVLRDDSLFEENKETLLGYGFSPAFNVWVEFTLTNTSQQTLTKTVEYNNPITTYLEFFDPDRKYEAQKDGLFTMNLHRKTINPTFQIQLNPYETKTYLESLQYDLVARYHVLYDDHTRECQ